VRLKLLGLAIVATLVSVNIWTGAPLLALWVGSRVVPESRLSMAAVFVVVIVLATLMYAMTLALAWLNARYAQLSGEPPEERRITPWLRSMRDEEEQVVRRRRGLSTIESIVAVSVVAAVIAFEVWFFFFAGPPIPKQ
jgi:hypothetical protein